MDKNELFSREHLAEVDIEQLMSKKVLLGGAGNTGSHFVERSLHNFLNIVFIVDFDKKGYEAHNFPHSSLLLNHKEDVGKPKAETLAMRANGKLLSNGFYKGMTLDIQDIGPNVVKQFDYALGFFDNTSARRYLYEISRLADVPFIEVGINEKIAQIQIYDHSKDASCYCCYRKESPNERLQSCATVYENDLKKGIAPSTDNYGAMIADFAVSALMNWEGNTEIEHNCRYILYPRDFRIVKEVKPKNPNCEVCSCDVDAPEIIELDGAVDELTYTEFINLLKWQIGNYRPSLSSIFVTKDYCPKCGKEKIFNSPSRRIKVSDLICEGCRENKADTYQYKRIDASLEHFSGFDEVPEKYQNYTLLQLGYPYGAYIDCINDEGEIITVTLKDDLKIIREFL